MIILSLILAQFNRLPNKILHGPQTIPVGHPLYNKHCWRCGWYIRKLVLFDKSIIQVVVYRFYCSETKKTYSLLPFFIERYERHINSVIEDVLTRHFLEGSSSEALAEDPAPSPWTVRRWLKKYRDKLIEIRPSVEEFLIANNPQYHPTAAWNHSFSHIWNDMLQKAEQLPIPNKNLILYSSLSYLLYAANIQSPKL